MSRALEVTGKIGEFFLNAGKLLLIIGVPASGLASCVRLIYLFGYVIGQQRLANDQCGEYSEIKFDHITCLTPAE